MSSVLVRDPSVTRSTRASNAIEVTHLRKCYAGREVVSDLSFSVAEGELFGLLGANGAGKTTTVEILQGLRHRDAGDVVVLGHDPQRDGDTLRRKIGAQLQDAALPDRMKVVEALRLFGSLHPSPRSIVDIADEWRLTDLLKSPFGALSGGERQRLFVALALIGQPRLVFLDELTQNLDPAARRSTWDTVRRVRETGTTVVLVTHDVEEAERLCDRVVILADGRKVADGSPRALVQSADVLVTVTFTDPTIPLKEIRRVEGVRSVRRSGAIVVVRGIGTMPVQVAARLVALDRPAPDFDVTRPTLEDHVLALLERNRR